MNEQQQEALRRGLGALAGTTREAAASPGVEAAVMAEMARARRQPFAGGGSYRVLPIAAALLIAVAGALWTAQREAPHRSGSTVNDPAGFVSLPGSEALPQLESASIIRVLLPVAALPVYGVAIAPDATGPSVEAELLVAQDGQTHAIRLVPRDSRSGSDD